MEIGNKFFNNAGQEFEVIKTFLKPTPKKTYKKALVKFLLTGTIKECYQENIIAGKVRDMYAPSCYDIGYFGDVDKTVKYYKQGYQLWRNMFKRCYSTKDPKGYYGKGIVVDARWHSLETFIKDLPKLKNFDMWLNAKELGVSYQLDKDFLGDGKVYSIHTCQFITEFENKSAGGKSRQGLPFK